MARWRSVLADDAIPGNRRLPPVQGAGRQRGKAGLLTQEGSNDRARNQQRGARGAPATLQTAEQAPSRRRWAVLAVLATVAFMAQLDLFIVNVALPALSKSFSDSGLNDLSWVLNAYAIAFAALLVPMGRLADHLGRRRFLLIGVAVFAIASAVCAAAPSLPVMIIGRVAQAVGGAMIVPTSLGLLYPSFPKREHSRVVGIWAAVASVAAASGPTVGGLLVRVDWRLIFLINIPIGLATIVGGLIFLPEIRSDKNARLPDALSAVALVASVALLTFATVQSSVWGWSSASTVGLLAGAAAAGLITVWRTLVHPHALIEARLFQSRQFTTATIALFLFFLAFAAWSARDRPAPGGRLALQRPPDRAGDRPRAGLGGSLRHQRRADHRALRPQGPAITGTLLFAAAGVFWLLATAAHPDYLAGMSARAHPGRQRRRADPGAPVRYGQHPARRPRDNRKRRTEHGAPGRQRDRRRHPGHPARLRARVRRLPLRLPVHRHHVRLRHSGPRDRRTPDAGGTCPARLTRARWYRLPRSRRLRGLLAPSGPLVP